MSQTDLLCFKQAHHPWHNFLLTTSSTKCPFCRIVNYLAQHLLFAEWVGELYLWPVLPEFMLQFFGFSRITRWMPHRVLWLWATRHRGKFCALLLYLCSEFCCTVSERLTNFMVEICRNGQKIKRSNFRSVILNCFI